MKLRRRDILRSHEIAMIWSRRAPLGPYPLILVLDGLKAGFNLAKIVRSANALGLREVFIVGVEAWDPVLARGTLEETRTRTFGALPDALAALKEEGYTVYALHPRGEDSFGAITFPEKTAFLVGHEQFGFSIDLGERPEVRLARIPQAGIVESMNVAVAASIAAYDYLRDRKLLGTAKPVAKESRASPLPEGALPEGEPLTRWKSPAASNLP
jgi:tRNA G18 (ribose-2'-O)-methylase SpoU